MSKSHNAFIGYAFAAAAAFLLPYSALAQLPQIPIAQTLKLPPDASPQWSGAPDEEVHFGETVGTDGHTAIVSVVRGRAAYAYIEKPNGKWVFQNELAAPDGYATVGASVLGDVALVQGRASNADHVVFVFKRTAGHWTHTQTLPGGSEGQGYHFVALGSDFAVIGVPYVFTNGIDVDHSTTDIYDSVGVGSYVFDTTLTPGGISDTSWQMGWNPQVDGDFMAVESPGNAEIDVFKRTGGVWTMEADFHDAPLPVTLSDQRVVYPTAGSARVFVRNNNGVWSLQQTITHPYGPTEGFQSFAALDGKRLLLADQEGNRVFLLERQGQNFVAVAELEQAAQSCPQFPGPPPTLTLKGRTAFVTCSSVHTHDPRFEGRVLVYELPPLQ